MKLNAANIQQLAKQFGVAKAKAKAAEEAKARAQLQPADHLKVENQTGKVNPKDARFRLRK